MKKNLFTILCFLISIQLNAQSEQCKILGQILLNGEETSKNAERYYIRASYLDKNDSNIQKKIHADHLGHFKVSLPKQTLIDFQVEFSGEFSPIDTQLTLETSELTLSIILPLVDSCCTYETAYQSMKSGKFTIPVYDLMKFQRWEKCKYTLPYDVELKFVSRPVYNNMHASSNPLEGYTNKVLKFLNIKYAMDFSNFIKQKDDSLLNYEVQNNFSFSIKKVETLTLKPLSELPYPLNKRLIPNSTNPERIRKKEVKKKMSELFSTSSYKRISQFERLTYESFKAYLPVLIQKITDTTLICSEIEDLEVNLVVRGLESNYPYATDVYDDLFVASGRANYLLKTISHENFGSIDEQTGMDELVRIQKHWLYWYYHLSK